VASFGTFFFAQTARPRIPRWRSARS